MSSIAVLALIVSLVAIGYRSPVEQQFAAQSPSQSYLAEERPSVDQVLASQLATRMAETAELPIASKAAEVSISLAAKSELAQTDDTLISKPQIVQPAAGSREIREYRAVEGDTVSKVASQFDVSENTVRWSNGLEHNDIEEGTVLSIPTSDGVLYTVEDGDTIASLADKFRVNAERITLYNDLELSGLTPGSRIMIPGGVLPESERPEGDDGGGTSSATTAPATSSSTSPATPSVRNAGNSYAYGYCTWYVYEKRQEIGRPIGSFWGDAVTWASAASSAGFTVNNSPAAGAVLHEPNLAPPFGHVSFVERVDPDGTVHVSEMNYAGWNVVSSRTIDAGQASSYQYIH